MTAKKLLLLLTITFLWGCSERLYVNSDYDKTADFSIYKTYNWSEHQEVPGGAYPQFDNEMNRKRIKTAVDKEMVAMGFKKTSKNPDLLVDYHISINKKMSNIIHNESFDYRQWSGYNTSSYEFKRGTLIIHFVDSKKKQLVWQGVGSKTLDDVPPEDTEERIQKAVKAIIAQYATVKK